MSLRILHLLDHSVPLHSGYTFRTLAILREQRRLGWDTIQLTSSKHYGAAADVEDFDGFRFYRTRVAESTLRKLPVLGQAAVVLDTLQRMNDVIDLTRPDLIHAHSPCLNGIAAIRAGRARAVPVVYEMRASWEDAAVDHGSTTERSVRYRLSRNLETWVLRRADAVTTICEGLRQEILGRGIPVEQATVVPNGVDLDEFPVIGPIDAGLKSKLNLDGCFVLGFLGSFYSYEGLDLLISALPAILAFEPTAKVLLVGGGREERALVEQAARIGLGDRVIMVGRVPHSEVARYYGIVDLLVYPRKSIRLTELVTPLKPLEAMAQGRLLIASNVGGHRELIRDGQTGFLFEPNDPRCLADAVNRVIESRGTWSSVRLAGRAFVEAERTWKAAAAQYPAVYARAQAFSKAHRTAWP
jgi:PEP-CTERM/exosortase A-associated glycosyltransferase